MRRLARLLLLTLALAAPRPTAAQVYIPDTIPGKGFFIGQLNLAKHITDFFLDKRDQANATKLDTNYVGNYPEKLMFSVGLASSGGSFRTLSDDGGFNLNSDMTHSLGLRACYRGLAIAFSVNPFNMFGNSDSEFDISLYGDRTVFDFVYQNSETLSGTYVEGAAFADASATGNTTAAGNSDQSIPKGFVNRRTMTFGGMYVFNSRRFSYAAAFDQTCVQKRSCGSLLLGGHYLYSRLRVDFEALGNIYSKSKILGIGGGYAYNLVLPRQWLISTSGLMEVGVWTRNRSILSEPMVAIINYINQEQGNDERYTTEQSFSYDYPPIIFIPRLAVVHHFGRCFAALTGLSNIHLVRQDGESNYNVVFTSNLLFGVRL